MLLSFLKLDRKTTPFGAVILACVEGGSEFGFARICDGCILRTSWAPNTGLNRSKNEATRSSMVLCILTAGSEYVIVVQDEAFEASLL